MKRAVVYLRLSQSREESVSIARQRKACRRYAEDRGWTVVGEFVDDGVSASKNAPWERPGWREMAEAEWDVVVAWKLDRVVRRIAHFWDTHRWLDERGKALATVEDSLDMTTTIGQMLAGLLAGFAQMEAEATSKRVTGARDYLLNSGRYAGGRLPYGYTYAPNPAGKGYVVVQDPDQAGVVREVVDRTLAGHSVHSTTRWLNERGVATQTWRPPLAWKEWRYNTVHGLLHNPLLAGLVPCNTGRASAEETRHSKDRGPGVVLGDNGLPLVHGHLAVMPVGEWRAMVARLDDPTVDPRRMPRAMRKTTDGTLSGLLWCAEHDQPVRMHRGTKASVKGTSYQCPDCYQTLSNVERLVVAEFLRVRGGVHHLDVVEEVVDGGAAEYAEATVRLQELSGRLALAEGDEFDALVAEIGRVKAVQGAASGAPSLTVYRQVHGDGETRLFAEDWERAEDDERRRTVLGHALVRVLVTRGRRGEWTDAAKLARMEFEWVPAGQVEHPGHDVLAAWAEGA